jgi:hypothetical protein
MINLGALQKNTGIEVEKFTDLQEDQCWEFTIVAGIIKAKLEPLRKHIEKTGHEIKFQKGLHQNQNKFRHFVEEIFHDFIKLHSLLYELSTQYLAPALVHEDANKINKLATAIEKVVSELKNFHTKVMNEALPQEELSHDMKHVFTGWMPPKLREMVIKEPLPEENLHIEVHRILREWVPYCCHAFDEIVETLASNQINDRNSERLNVQFSFAPPTIYYFIRIAGLLKVGKEGPRALRTEFGSGIRDSKVIAKQDAV